MIVVPQVHTLKKYGLTVEDYLHILESQGNVCAVCGKPSGTGKYYVDHFHAQGYKKMKAEKKKLYVRGVLCYMCNRFYVAKGITVDKARGVLNYLERFEKRRPK